MDEKNVGTPKAELVVMGPVREEVLVDKDDVLAVGITEAEEFMQAQVAVANDNAKEARQSAQEHYRAKDKALTDRGVEVRDELETRMADVFRDLGCHKVTFTVQSCDLSQDDGKAYFVSYTVNASDGKGTMRFTRSTREKAPKKAVEELKAAAEAEKTARDWEASALEWKRRLTRLPQYERKLRAEIAKTRLAKTPAGKEILQAMLGDVKNRVLALPGK